MADVNENIVSDTFIIRDASKILEKRCVSRIKFQGKSSSESSEEALLFKLEACNLFRKASFVLAFPIGSLSNDCAANLHKCHNYLAKCFDYKCDSTFETSGLTTENKPPTFYLNVLVVEARDLESKDIDGFSDPYCIMGIIPGSSQLIPETAECTESEFLSQLNQSNSTSGTDSMSLNVKRNSGSRFRQSFRRRVTAHLDPQSTNCRSMDSSGSMHTTCLKDSQIPVKLMRTTTVKENTLDPVWNEKFQFELDDITTDRFHLDIWDHDEETSVLDAVRSLNEIKGVKQLGRYFKQVGQSARKGQSGDLDDFLGCITVAIKDIPTTGLEGWFKLAGRSARSKVQGSIHLTLKLTTINEQDELHGPKLDDIRVHTQLMYAFINYELKQSKKPCTEWSGILPTEAEFVLGQHAEHVGLTDVHKAMCRWISFAKVYRRRPIRCHIVKEKLKKIISAWTDKSLTHEQMEMLSNSFKGFTEHAIALISQCQVVFSVEHPESLQHLECLLSCLEELHHSRLFQFCSPFGNTLQSELTNAFKKRATTNYELMKPTQSDVVESGTSSFTNTEILRHVMHLINLNEELNVASRVYSPLCMKYVGVNLLGILRKTYSNLLHQDLVHSELLVKLIAACDVDARRGSSRPVTVEGHSQFSAPLMRELFALYHSMREFEALVSDGANEDEYDEETSQSVIWYSWFESVLSSWVYRCSSILPSLTEKALQGDQLCSPGIANERALKSKDPVTRTSSDPPSEPIISVSAERTVRWMNNALLIWKLFDWPDRATRGMYGSVIVQAVCEAALLYAKTLHEQLRLQGYCDEQGQFDISDQLCIGLNNLDSVIQCVNQIPDVLEWKTSSINSVNPSSSPDRHHNVDDDQPRPHQQQRLEQDECSLEHLERIRTEGLANLHCVLDRLFSRVKAKMRPEIRKNVFHLCWCANKTPTEKAIYDLFVYLESNLKTLGSYVSGSIFRRFLFELWSECLSQFVEQVHREAEIGPNASGPGAYLMPSLETSTPGRCIIPLATHFTNDDHMSALPEHITRESILRARSILLKLKQALELLLQFFLKMSQGQLQRTNLDDQNFKDVHYLIQLYISSTPELIELHFLEKIKEQESTTNTQFGLLKVNVTWQGDSLIVEVLSACGLTPLDSNGLSDPFVLIDLVPAHLFCNLPKQARTRVIKNTLDPVFNERFEFTVKSEELHHPAACLVFVVMDHDLLLSDDLEGTAVLSLASIFEPKESTGNGTANNAQSIPQSYRALPIVHPTHGKYSALHILGQRTDANAQEIYKRWQVLDRPKDAY